MAKRGRKPKVKIDIGSYKDTLVSGVSLLSITAGFVSLIAVFTGLFNSSGTFSSYLEKVFTNNFGISSIILSVVLIYFGFLFIGSIKWQILNYKVFTGLLLLLISTLGIFGSMAGRIGNALQIKTTDMLSFPGAIFMYFILFVVAIALLSNKGMEHVVSYFASFFEFIKNKFFRVNMPDEEGIDEESLALNSENERLLLEEQKTYNIKNFVDGEEAENETPDSMDFQSATIVSTKPISQFDHPTLKGTSDWQIIRPPSAPVGEDEDNLSQASIEEEEEVEAERVVPAKGQPKLPFSNRVWEYPSIDILSNTPNIGPDAGNVQERAKAIEDTLSAFGVKANVVDIHSGPAVTQYALNLAIGTKASKIQNLSTDLALRIKSPSGSVRVVAPIPGTNLVGIEVPNFTPSSVSLRSVLNSPEMKKSKSKLSIAVGVDVQGNAVIQDMAKWPHALVAGSTGSGKSVLLNAIIASLLFRCSPAECRFIMIDPKMVEMTQYNGIPHLLTPVVTDMEQKAVSALAWAVSEMERRYKSFEAAKVRNIEGFNAQSGFQAEPYIVIVIDELADMMMVASADVEKYIARLAQKSRAVGIHLVIATQRPSVNVLTGIIKANVPTRIAFKVASNVDSRVIIDQSGAETLIGKGDMLFVPPSDSKANRIQGVWVSDPEITALVNKLKESGVEPDYKEEIVQLKVGSNNNTNNNGSVDNVDEKMMEALEIIINEGKASASYLQRRLGLGYSRAARIIDELEAYGIIGRANGSKPRDVLVHSIETAVSKMTGSSGGSDSSDDE